MLNHNPTRAFINSFKAVGDAIVIENDQDETGASAAILVKSRVSSKRYLQSIFYQNGYSRNPTREKK